MCHVSALNERCLLKQPYAILSYRDLSNSYIDASTYRSVYTYFFRMQKRKIQGKSKEMSKIKPHGVWGSYTKQLIAKDPLTDKLQCLVKDCDVESFSPYYPSNVQRHIKHKHGALLLLLREGKVTGNSMYVYFHSVTLLPRCWSEGMFGFSPTSWVSNPATQCHADSAIPEIVSRYGNARIRSRIFYVHQQKTYFFHFSKTN